MPFGTTSDKKASFVTFVIMVAVLGFGAFGCEDSFQRSNPYDENTPADDQAKATVKGQVLLEGQALEQQDAVTITLEGEGQTLTTTSGEDGLFSFDQSVKPGNWSLRFTLARYQESLFGPFQIAAGQELTAPVLNLLLRRASLQGSVVLDGVDAAGDPIQDFSGVSVLLRQSGSQSSKLRAKEEQGGAGLRSYSGTTDSDGEFFLSGVPFGDYDLLAGKEGFSSASDDVEVGKENVDIDTITLVSSMGVVVIAEGEAFTHDPKVAVSLQSSSPIKSWELSEDPDFPEDETLSGTVSPGKETEFVSVEFSLSQGDGEKTVYGRYLTLADVPSEVARDRKSVV